MPRTHRNSRRNGSSIGWYLNFLEFLVWNPAIRAEFGFLTEHIGALFAEIHTLRQSNQRLAEELEWLRSVRGTFPQTRDLELSRAEIRRRIEAARHLLREMSRFLPRGPGRRFSF